MALKFRRGSTAQQSGSLAFGEPYFNTDFNTLLVGGQTGDIVLAAAGTSSAFIGASVSASNFVSASNLKVTGNASIDGNVTIGGTIQIGDQTSDVVNVVASLSSSLIPQTTNVFDLGSSTKIWRDLYISTGSIKFVDPGTNTIVGTLSSNAGGDFKVAGEISGSTISGLGNATLFSQSVDNRLVAVEAFSASLDNSFATDAQLSSLSTSVKLVTDTFATSASVASATATSISTLSSSVKMVTDTFATSASVASATATSISTLSSSIASTDSTQTSNISNLQTDVNNVFGSASAYSASAAIALNNLSSSVKAVTDTFATSASVASATATSISSLSSSVKAVTDTFATSASVASATATSISTLSSSIALTDSTQTTNITANSASAARAFASASAYSASAATTYAQLIGANIFTGTQTITGSLFVSQNLIVQGSSSLQNITASAVSIGTNTVILNTDAPSVRFGGIKVIDSGSSASTGSLLWDSENNVWIYTNPDGANYASARLIAGPKNSGSLGSEIGLTVGQVPVAIGDDHIGDSIISASATKITIAGGLDVTGNISASTLNGVGNVTAYSTSVASRINTIETTYATSASIASATATSISTLSGSVASATATSITTLSSSVKAVTDTFATSASVAAASSTAINSLSSSVKAVTDTFATSASVASATATSISTFSGSVKAVTDTFATSASVASATATSISTLSGSVKGVTDALSGRVTTLEGKDITITLTGDVTGTGTSTDLGAVSFATTIGANSVALGTDTTGDYVASMTAGAGITVGTATGEGSTPVITNTGVTSITGTSNQVIASAGTGGVTLSLPQSIATTSAVSFASVTTTGDIVAYSTSDKRHKNNIQPITEAVAKVTKLNGVTWEWNDDVDDVTKLSPKTGLIAQEVHEVLPEVVTERENGFLGLDYSKMMGLMVEAIKEQQQQIHSLTLEIEKLKKSNSL